MTKCLKLIKNVPTMMADHAAPWASMPSAISCADPAITSADISSASPPDSPAWTARSPMEIPTGTTPRQAGTDALTPAKKSSLMTTRLPFCWFAGTVTPGWDRAHYTIKEIRHTI